MDKVNKLIKDLFQCGTSEKRAVLAALISINGYEQGIIDYYAYYYGGNYNWTIDDVIEDFYN